MSAAGGLSYIEQLNNADKCTTPRRPILRAVNHTEHVAVFFRPRCKLWSCPYCAEENRKLWIARAYYGAAVLEQVCFLTLTSHPKLSPAASVGVFGQAWNVLRLRARRSAPEGQFMMIPERHKDGRLHAHAIETFALGTRWWKDNAAECGLGYMAEEDVAHTPQGAAWYVGKYMTKQLEGGSWPKGWRRARTSRDWPKLPPMPVSEDWSFTSLPNDEALNTAIARLEQGGYFIIVADTGSAWDVVG
jgi:hypothetical protein